MQKKVLLVDDDPDIIKSLKFILMREGYDVFTAMNGLEGLEIYNDELLSLDLIITDIQMPEMDGIEFIKNIARTECPSIIIYSAHFREDSNLTDEYPCVRAIIPKPLEYKAFKNLIKKVMT